MGLWAVRWPNGDLSIVSAKNLADAYDLVDQVADPGGAEWKSLKELALHFHLTETGAPQLDDSEGMDERGREEVLEWAYPVLDGLRMETEGYPKPADLEAAIKKEKERELDLSETKTFMEVVEPDAPPRPEIERRMGRRPPGDPLGGKRSRMGYVDGPQIRVPGTQKEQKAGRLEAEDKSATEGGGIETGPERTERDRWAGKVGPVTADKVVKENTALLMRLALEMAQFMKVSPTSEDLGAEVMRFVGRIRIAANGKRYLGSRRLPPLLAHLTEELDKKIATAIEQEGLPE